MIYSFSREVFNEKMEEFNSCETCSKYPQYAKHLEKSYADRQPTWAMFSRRERQLPTHGSNTNAYAEISMKATKETQFGRIKTRNLPEMLMKICDNSAMYRDKLIEVGNNRAILKRARSKYIGPKTTLTIDQVLDLGESCYIVQSELDENIFYDCNMKTGFCSCGKGVNSAPCKHKSAVASLHQIAELSVAPNDDPCARALYHYIATGTTLPAHMYRERGSGQTLPEIEKYIDEKLRGRIYEKLDVSMMVEDPVIEAGLANNEEQDEENEEQNEKIRENFLQAIQDYAGKVVEMSQSGEAGTLKAMKAMTKTL